MSKNEQGNLCSIEEMSNVISGAMQFQQQGPVACLGMEFENDEACRVYFREELRKKLPELRKIEGFPIGEDDDIKKFHTKQSPRCRFPVTCAVLLKEKIKSSQPLGKKSKNLSSIPTILLIFAASQTEICKYLHYLIN